VFQKHKPGPGRVTIPFARHRKQLVFLKHKASPVRNFPALPTV
jgi:hypothetical protein